MKLKQYLKENKITQLEFAEKLGITRVHLNYICADTPYKPSVKLADKIEKATDGAVSFEELLRPKF